jgi:quercetin dioxygenase-like cupin family protein
MTTLRPVAICVALVLLSCECAAADEPVPMRRLTPTEIQALLPGAGPTPGIGMTLLTGDPTKPGLYTVRVAFPAHARVRPHTHRDNRSVVVVSGTWHVGYGGTFNAADLKELPAGSFYTEPAGQPHFGEAGDEPVVIWVTGYGPSDTKFVSPEDGRAPPPQR